MLRYCRYVDEVVFELDLCRQLAGAVRQHKVNFLPGHANPNNAGGEFYDWAKQAGMFLETRRTPGVSSSELRRLIGEKEAAGKKA